MASIVFVHGSGIRAERYARMLQTVEQGLRTAGHPAALVPCGWGEEHGSHLHAGGASFRDIGAGSAGPGRDDTDPELAAWTLAEQEQEQEHEREAGPASRWAQVTAGLHFRPGGLRLGTSLLGTSSLGASLNTSLQESSSAFTGDIALYLSRGTSIRDAIRTAVAGAEPPVTVLAHSLGGVATVDLLVEKPIPEVELLVTVATQAGFLYEIDALPSLRFGDPLPDTFPRWVNVLDRRDALAYMVQPLFPGRAVDQLVDNRAPFPLAHTAYFNNSRFYRVLAGLGREVPPVTLGP
ncbi:MAG: hypothetical protein LH603_14295 [Pseudonocardia sp.]|nr:hypothetical protein [Pseudonocardia sp.]